MLEPTSMSAWQMSWLCLAASTASWNHSRSKLASNHRVSPPKGWPGCRGGRGLGPSRGFAFGSLVLLHLAVRPGEAVRVDLDCRRLVTVPPDLAESPDILLSREQELEEAYAAVLAGLLHAQQH